MSTSRKNDQQVKQVFDTISDAIEAGQNVKDACISAGVSPSFYYYWRNRLKASGWLEPGAEPVSLIEENRLLRRLLAEQVLENTVLRDKYGAESADAGSKRNGAQAGLS